MMEHFSVFSSSTGLTANHAKCKVFFGGVSDVEQARILATTGFTCGSLSFKYLGVPLTSQKLYVHQCWPLIDKIVAKTHHWASKMLSYAGRY